MDFYFPKKLYYSVFQVYHYKAGVVFLLYYWSCSYLRLFRRAFKSSKWLGFHFYYVIVQEGNLSYCYSLGIYWGFFFIPFYLRQYLRFIFITNLCLLGRAHWLIYDRVQILSVLIYFHFFLCNLFSGQIYSDQLWCNWLYCWGQHWNMYPFLE